jgi:kinesin family protein 3/17
MTKAEREAVKVAVRLRPMSSNEESQGFHSIIEVDQKNAQVYVKNPAGQTVNFKFDYAYPDGIAQEEIYETTASPIVSGVLEGFNGTIFAYGQTGTGKTYTMDGKKGDDRGIVPRAFEHIFDYIQANSEDHQFMLTATYVEIYNDELRDLLASGPPAEPLKIREDPNHGIQIKGVATHKAQKIDDLWVLLNFGKKNRKVRKTNMNAESSRSHSILTLNIETLTQIEGGQHVRCARLNLVDLAGSERVAKTGAEGQGFKEGVNINYELMILGNCIAALTTRGNTHIPYRDSKLTMLLRDSLGGNARTVMIAALGPANYNFSETMSTLRYAERAKKIENKPKVNMDPKDALLMKYQEELQALQAQLNGVGLGGFGGPGGMSIEDRIAEMEKALADKRAKLASATTVAKAEREQMEKELERKRQEMEQEKERQAQLQARFAELGKYLVNGQNLKQRTEKNEQEIEAIRAKLKLREEHAKAMEKEIEERRLAKQQAVDKCASVQSQVEMVSRQFTETVDSYRNLQLKMAEVQNTIQADKDNMAENVDYLNKRIELYTVIIDNFVPQSEAEATKRDAVYDEETNKWRKPDLDRKTLVQTVVSLDRPKSALGMAYPTAGGPKKLKKPTDEPFTIQLAPSPVRSRLKPGPMRLRTHSIEDSITAAFQESYGDAVVEVSPLAKAGDNARSPVRVSG